MTDTELLLAVIKLRNAQRAYMADRGNDVLGRKVAEAAKEVDALIERRLPIDH